MVGLDPQFVAGCVDSFGANNRTYQKMPDLRGIDGTSCTPVSNETELPDITQSLRPVSKGK